MSTPTPWTMERRSAFKRRIDKEAARVAGRIGATSVIIIAFARDGEYLHMQDGGTAPGDISQIYKMLITAHEGVASSGGIDVVVQ